jgi:hypothetical protein
MSSGRETSGMSWLVTVLISSVGTFGFRGVMRMMR